MKNLLDNKLVTFLISFFLAVILWLYVQGELQIRKTIQVKVNYLRTEKLVAVGPRDHELKVDIRGPAAVVTSVESQGNHQIDIDLRNRKPGVAYQGNLDYLLSRQFPRGVDFLRVQPREIRFQIDEYGQKTVPLTVDLVGEPAEGFQVVDQKLTPEKVVIGGGKSVLKDIEKVAIGPVDLANRRENIRLDKPIETGSPDYWVVGKGEVNGQIEIEEKIIQKGFRVSIQMRNSDYRYKVSPSKIRVVVEGTYGQLQALKTKDFLAYVDGQKMRAGSYRKPIAIKPPNGIKLIDNEPRYFSIRLWKSKK